MKEDDFYGWKIKVPKEKKLDLSKNNGVSISLALITTGIFILAFGIFFFLLSYSTLKNPLFNVSAEESQIAVIIGLTSGIAGLIAGFAVIVKGFIDYTTRREPIMDESGYFKMSILFLILTWLIFPMVFGPLAVYSGYVIYSRWNRNKGITIIILGIIFTIMSYIISAQSMQELLK